MALPFRGEQARHGAALRITATIRAPAASGIDRFVGPYLEEINKRWIKNSGVPIGYVYNGIGEAPAGAVPVYAYYRKDTQGDHLATTTY